MLIYETEGFLEVEAKHIQHLCRSTVAVSLDQTERESTTLHAVLCDYLDNSEPRCRVAFYSKLLKRAFVFAVKSSARHTPWQFGQNTLVQLGFVLEDVNLKLSPAMLEVVLRDVPGLLSPGEARKQRTEKSALLAKFQKSCDEAPGSAQGKKAALKLNAENRLNAQAVEVRHFLEELLSAKENASAEFEALVNQVKDLTSRLETAAALAESERNQREMSESITSAAEKRIQELEEVLVDVETKSSKTIKQKQKNVQLQARIKELGRELEAAEAELENEREKQEQFIADVTAAHEQIALLENDLKGMDVSRIDWQTQLTEELAKKSQLAEHLVAAELRIKALGAELETAEEHAAEHNESAELTEQLQAQLTAVQMTLQDSLERNNALQEQLTTADEENKGLIERLDRAVKKAHDNTLDEAQLLALAEQNEQLSGELEKLRDEHEQDCTLRQRLERAAEVETERIQELESSLAKMSASVAEEPSEAKDSQEGDRQLDSLQTELQELKQRFNEEQKCRAGLESDVDDAHKLIDSLEKMVRETEDAATAHRSDQTSKESENQLLQELEKKLLAVENQLEHERGEQKKLIKAVVVAENKLAEQEERLAQGQAVQLERKIQEHSGVAAAAQKPSKPLPHDLRPAPKQGSLFHPAWDLTGLPCRSSAQVYKAWETVFNVQTSLEGYPSQYCMAFLVVLRQKQQKSIYMLYRLKLNKHTLVCVPSKTPMDEASLNKTIKEGLNFLKLSGFDMEELSIENLDSTLKGYFMEA